MAKIERVKATQVAECAKAIDCRENQANKDGCYTPISVVCAKANPIWHSFYGSVHCPLCATNYFGLMCPHLASLAVGYALSWTQRTE